MDQQPSLPADHPPVTFGRVGVMIVNLGTPEGTSYGPMRRYLKQFLSDRRVIEANPVLWKIILNLFILSTRPQKSGKAYESVWNTELDEGPLRTFTRAKADKLTGALAPRFPQLIIDWAMRYGKPSIEERITALVEQGCDKVLVFALYPQYSATTTATVYDEAFRALMKLRRQPALRTVPAYYDHPLYIDALARSVKAQIAREGWEPEVVLASFHGIPQSYFEQGDPYHCHCQKTGRLLRQALGWGEDKLRVTFQSRFGPQEWLQPYTDETLTDLAREGVRDIMVLTPGFAADCLETLEEIAIEGREQFEQAGGQRYAVVPCLNDGEDQIALLSDIIARELSGWMEPAATVSSRTAALR